MYWPASYAGNGVLSMPTTRNSDSTGESRVHSWIRPVFRSAIVCSPPEGMALAMKCAMLAVGLRFAGAAGKPQVASGPRSRLTLAGACDNPARDEGIVVARGPAGHQHGPRHRTRRARLRRVHPARADGCSRVLPAGSVGEEIRFESARRKSRRPQLRRHLVLELHERAQEAGKSSVEVPGRSGGLLR